MLCAEILWMSPDYPPSSPHKNYADDLVLQTRGRWQWLRRWAKTSGGLVVRMDLDGKNAEFYASGQRNTYDIAFNRRGNSLASIATWMGLGMPWYRPIRAFHVVSVRRPRLS